MNNIIEIDNYLMQRMDEGEATLFSAKLLLDPQLKEQVYWQQQTYAEIRKYGRRQLLKEINAVHNKLFSLPQYSGFKAKILGFFSK